MTGASCNTREQEGGQAVVNRMGGRHLQEVLPLLLGSGDVTQLAVPVPRTGSRRSCRSASCSPDLDRFARNLNDSTVEPPLPVSGLSPGGVLPFDLPALWLLATAGEQ